MKKKKKNELVAPSSSSFFVYGGQSPCCFCFCSLLVFYFFGCHLSFSFCAFGFLWSLASQAFHQRVWFQGIVCIQEVLNLGAWREHTSKTKAFTTWANSWGCFFFFFFYHFIFSTSPRDPLMPSLVLFYHAQVFSLNTALPFTFPTHITTSFITSHLIFFFFSCLFWFNL